MKTLPTPATRMQRWLVLVVFLLVSTVLAPLEGDCLGLRIPMQDATAVGRGNAFTATADNPSAIYYNPAGIAQLEGTEVQFGLLAYLGITSSYTSPSGSRAETAYETVMIPQLYLTTSP